MTPASAACTVRLSFVHSSLTGLTSSRVIASTQIPPAMLPTPLHAAPSGFSTFFKSSSFICSSTSISSSFHAQASTVTACVLAVTAELPEFHADISFVFNRTIPAAPNGHHEAASSHSKSSTARCVRKSLSLNALVLYGRTLLSKSSRTTKNLRRGPQPLIGQVDSATTLTIVRQLQHSFIPESTSTVSSTILSVGQCPSNPQIEIPQQVPPPDETDAIVPARMDCDCLRSDLNIESHIGDQIEVSPRPSTRRSDSVWAPNPSLVEVEVVSVGTSVELLVFTNPAW